MRAILLASVLLAMSGLSWADERTSQAGGAGGISEGTNTDPGEGWNEVRPEPATGEMCCRYHPDFDINGDGTLSETEADTVQRDYGVDVHPDVGTGPYW